MFKVINEGSFQEDNWKKVILETYDRAEALSTMREFIDAFKKLPRKERRGVVNIFYVTEA